MKMLGRAFASAMTMLLSTFAGSSSPEARTISPVDTVWAETVERDTLQAYAQFAMMFPDSQYTEVAYQKLASLEVARTVTTDAPDRQEAAADIAPRRGGSEPYLYFAAS